jgi:adenylate cyclase class 2
VRRSGRLLRLRRSGPRATVTYKGPIAGGRYKSREEIEFDVSDPDAFIQTLDRLGYAGGFRYEKERTKFARPDEPGIVTIDETPIGVFMELEGPTEWIDQTAARLGFSPADYMTASYASLYGEFRKTNPEAPEDMTFGPSA